MNKSSTRKEQMRNKMRGQERKLQMRQSSIEKEQVKNKEKG